MESKETVRIDESKNINSGRILRTAALGGLVGIGSGATAAAVSNHISQPQEKPDTIHGEEVVTPQDFKADNIALHHGMAAFDLSKAEYATAPTDDMSFNQAFAAARAQVGPDGVFHWRGRIYSTMYREEWAEQPADWRHNFSTHDWYTQFNIEPTPAPRTNTAANHGEEVATPQDHKANNIAPHRGMAAFDLSEAEYATAPTDDMSFNKAFAAARAQVGPDGVFHWRGRIYSTMYREEWAEQPADWRHHFSTHDWYTQFNIEPTPVPHTNMAGNHTTHRAAGQATAQAANAGASAEEDIEILAIGTEPQSTHTNELPNGEPLQPEIPEQPVNIPQEITGLELYSIYDYDGITPEMLQPGDIAIDEHGNVYEYDSFAGIQGAWVSLDHNYIYDPIIHEQPEEITELGNRTVISYATGDESGNLIEPLSEPEFAPEPEALYTESEVNTEVNDIAATDDIDNNITEVNDIAATDDINNNDTLII